MPLSARPIAWSILAAASFAMPLPCRAISARPVAERGTPDPRSALVGTWRGESICLDRGTACRDEIAVYRIAIAADKPNTVLVTGGKLVDGREVVMGTSEGRYDGATHTITTQTTGGTVVLKVDGTLISGTFTLPDGRLLRRIALRKS